MSKFMPRIRFNLACTGVVYGKTMFAKYSLACFKQYALSNPSSVRLKFTMCCPKASFENTVFNCGQYVNMLSGQ